MSAIDTDAVGELIRELCASYNVVRIPCDRAYNVRLMGQLLAEGLPIEEFAQTDQNMTRACQRLFDVVAKGRLRHGNDRVLSEYMLNAAVKTGRRAAFASPSPMRVKNRRRHRAGHGSRRCRGRVGVEAEVSG